jgi:broad specificity phosphatase PhoE
MNVGRSITTCMSLWLLLVSAGAATGQSPAGQSPAGPATARPATAGRATAGQSTAGQATVDTGTLRIYLARHGQTDGNLNNIAQGFTDTPLNATGKGQAAQLAATLKGVQFDAIYSSTLSRSRETAETVAAGRPVRSLADLREMNLGRFENRPIGDPEMRKRRGGPDAPEDGESGEQFYERVSGAIKGILDTHKSGAILIVGHGGANLQILRTLLSTKPGTRMGTQANDELYMIEMSAGATPRVFKYFPMDKLGEL